MQVLSLFNGMAVASQALKELGIKPEKTYVSDIDKWANDVTRYNHPDNIHIGDVTKWREWNIDWSKIDLVLGGSPCQGFSFAGKQLAFDDPRSALFFEFMNILNHIKQQNPNVKFMLENVKMKKEFLDTISTLIKAEPILINSSLVTAQNRQRYYWTKEDIKQPEDKGIVLKDILQDDSEVDDKYYIDTSKFDLSWLDAKENSKKTTRVANIGNGGQGQRVYSEDGKSVTLSALGGGQGAKTGLYKINKKGKLKSNQDKASCLTGGAHSGGNHSDMDLIAKGCAQRGRYNEDGSTSQKIEVRDDNKSNCLTLAQKDSLVIDNFNIRRLTPVECERLQGLPDGYTKYGRKEDGTVYEISDTQRYKMLGNGWTLPVIKHIFEQILGGNND